MILLPFDIIAFKGKSLVSKIIRGSTNSNYSHVSLVLSNFHLIDTDFRQPLKIRHFDYNLGTFDGYRLKQELTDEQKIKMNEFIQKKLNTKYDVLEAVSYLSYKYIGFVIDDKNKMICSSWINEIYKVAGIELIKEYKGIIVPQDIINSELLTKIN